MANLVELYDLVIQAQALNGVPLSHGHVYVYALGRTKLMDTWSDIDGESLNPNPVILDNAGQAHIYVSDDFDYTLVFTDEFDNEIFSVDKYLLSKGEHSHADVAVAPSEHIGVSSYHVGEVTVYVPYITGNFGKTYEGIDPIVVNNDINKISANNIPLGVQDPLYFVEDSETACIIGCSAQTEIPSALSGKWDNASDTVIANSAQWSENTTYEAGSYVDIDNNTISVTGLQPAGNYQSAGNYVSASELENLQPKGDYYSASNPSGFLINEDITGKLDTTAFSTVSGDFLTAIPSEYVTENTLQSGLSSKLDSTAFSTVSGNFLTAHQSLEGYATEQWVEDKGYITGVDIPESATWNATTETVSSNSAQWGATNPQIPVTGINGIKISESGDKVVFEVSADYALTDDLTGKQDSLTFGYKDTAISSIDESAIYDNSAHARITTLAGRISDLSSNKLDTSAFSDVSGTFLTAHQSLDGLMSADLLEFSGSVITAYSGCKFAGEVSGDAGDAEVNALVHSNSGDWDSVTSKLDESAFSDVSGSFITAIPDLYVYNSATKLEIGSDNTANYDGAIAIGQYNSARENSIAMGGWNNAREYSVAMGGANTAISDSIAVGEYCSAGYNAQAFGYYVTSQSGMAIGNANLTTSAAFVIGNGNATMGQYSDLFRIDPDAKAYIQKATTGMSGYAIEVYNRNYDYWQTWQLNNSLGITRVEFPRNNTAAAAGGNLLVSAMQPNMTYTTGLIALSSDGSILFNPDDYGTNIGQVFFTKRSNTYNIKDPNQANATGYTTAVFKSMVRMATLDDIPSGSELPESASEALNVVTSNSASWDEISAYIASSASYITSLPADLVYTGDITGKLDTTAFSTVSGDFYTTANESGFITGVDLSDYATTAEVADKLDTTAFSTVSGTFLTAHQDISNKVDLSAYNELKSSYDALSSLFSTYSGQWLLPNIGV